MDEYVEDLHCDLHDLSECSECNTEDRSYYMYWLTSTMFQVNLAFPGNQRRIFLSHTVFLWPASFGISAGVQC